MKIRPYCLVMLIAAMLFFAFPVKGGKGHTGGSFENPDFAFPKAVEKNALAVLDKSITSDPERAVKALLQIIIAQEQISTDDFSKSMHLCDSVAEKLPSPWSQIIRSLQAQAYYNFSQFNLQDCNLPLDAPRPENINEWSDAMLSLKVQELVEKSLSDAKALQSIPLGRIKGLLKNYTDHTETYMPSVYDLLAWRGVEYLGSLAGNRRVIPFTKDPSQVSSPEQKADVLRNRIYSALEVANADYPYALAYTYTQQAYLRNGQWLYSRYESLKSTPASLMVLYKLRSFISADGDKHDSQSAPLSRKEYYAMATEALKHFPKSDYSDAVRQSLKSMEEVSVKVNLSGISLSGADLPVKVSASNITTFHLLLVNVKSDGDNSWASNKEIRAGKLMADLTVHLDGVIPFSDTVTVYFPAVQTGYYAVVPSTSSSLKDALGLDSDGNSQLIRVGSLTAFYTNVSVSKQVPRLYVMEADGKKPVKGVSVKQYGNYYPDRNKLLQSGVTDACGSVELTQRNAQVEVKHGDETFAFNTYIHKDKQQKAKNEYIKVLTNLALYHPGDSVGFAAILYRDTDKSFSPIPGKELEAKLYNVNGEKVDSLRLITDEFGRAWGSMKLSSDGVLGRCRVEVSEGNNAKGLQSVMVSEYKAPTFFVELDSVASEYKPGDDVLISGIVRTYSGMAVGGAKVSLKVDYRPLCWWWRNSNDNATFGQDAESEADGRFSFSLPTENLKDTPFESGVFSVTVTAVSPAGESRESSSELFCLDKSYNIVPSLPTQFCAVKDTLSANVTLFNAAATPQQGMLTYKVRTADGNPVSEGEFMSPCFRLPVAKLPSGKYLIEFAMKSDSSVTITDEVILFRSDDKRPPCPSILWIPEKVITAPTGAAKVKVTVGNSYGGAVLCQITSDSTLLSSKWLYPEGGNIQVEVPAPKTGSHVYVSFIAIHNFETSVQTVTVQPQSDTERLDVEIETFRDKIHPGSSETWTFRFRNSVTGTPGRIPALAVMSNQALNALYDFTWNFSTSHTFSCPLRIGSYSVSSASWNYYHSSRTGRYFTFNPPEIYTYGYNLYPGGKTEAIPIAYGRGLHLRKAQLGARNEIKSDALEEPYVLEEENVDSGSVVHTKSVAIAKEDTEAKEEIRPVECPLAFFQPSLVSDARGKLDVRFRVPNFNTSWQFQLLGYDMDMHTAVAKLYSEASKPVMVQSLTPRFLRTGDNVELRATLYNNTDEPQTINGIIEVLNPLDGTILSRSEKAVDAVAAHGSSVIKLSYSVPADLQAVIVRSRAETGNFTDAEQTLIGILPSTSPVTEATDFYLDPEQKEFSILLPRYESGNVILQYCNNPVWYCLTAMPEISTPKSDNLLSLVYAYYGNALSMSLADKYPQIRQALRIWNADKANSPLRSALQSNSELKTLTLNNTIWLNDASAETLRMSKLIDLLDTASNCAAQRSLIKKMKSLQTPDGGWQWLKGMDPSLYLSSHVLLYLGQLRQMDCLPTDADIADMIGKAIDFCDREVLEIYRLSQKHKDSFPLYSMLSYFYIRSFYDKAASTDVASLRKRTISELAGRWRSLDIYNAATAATLLYRNGEKATARLILESLRQKATTASGKGMWYDNVRSAYNPSDPLICTVQVLEAYSEIEPEAKEIDGLRQWLVLQRQAQNWGLDRNLAEVAYAILTSGTDWIRPDSSFDITLGGKSIRPDRFQSLTGEFTMPLERDLASESELKINNPDIHPAWGGVLSQYIQPIADVRPSDVQDLSIKKEVFVVRTTNAGEQVIHTDSLKVGDKVRVTLTLTVGRDMEYVTITDERAVCLEPTDQLPHYVWQKMAGYYYEPRNTQTNIFINYLSKGVHTFTYDCYVQQQGEFGLGIATAQSFYAPLIVAHSGGRILTVE